ncbi:MAG: hypothetical protein IJ679_01865, partial [Lachnospiraceae bacterium]|nr:hypothetical protein [Lachnospiraceae bacterium]
MKKFVALVMGMILACSEAAVGNMTVLASDVTEEAGSVQEDISLEEEVLSENENNEESTEEFGSEEIDVAESSESETEEDAAGIFDDTDAAEDIGVSVFEENENDSVEIDPIVEDAERSEDEVREAVEKIEDETVNDVLFDETDYFSYSENEDGTITIYNYNDPEGYLDEIPGTIDGKKVTVIGDLAFNNCSIDDDLVIPSSVTTIEYGA